MSSKPPTTPEGPAASAGKREARSPQDEPLATMAGGEEHPQRFGKGQVDTPEAPPGATKEVQELTEEAAKSAERPYEPQSTKATPK
jgi:hypothetical protein